MMERWRGMRRRVRPMPTGSASPTRGLVMRRLLTVAVFSLASTANGQRPDTLPGSENLPAPLRHQVESRGRSPAELRAFGPVTIAADSTVPGAVAVQNGPLIIAGRV